MSKGWRFKGQKIHMDLVFSGGGEGSEFFQPYQFILAEMYLEPINAIILIFFLTLYHVLIITYWTELLKKQEDETLMIGLRGRPGQGAQIKETWWKMWQIVKPGS